LQTFTEVVIDKFSLLRSLISRGPQLFIAYAFIEFGIHFVLKFLHKYRVSLKLYALPTGTSVGKWNYLLRHLNANLYNVDNFPELSTPLLYKNESKLVEYRDMEDPIYDSRYECIPIQLIPFDVPLQRVEKAKTDHLTRAFKQVCRWSQRGKSIIANFTLKHTHNARPLFFPILEATYSTRSDGKDIRKVYFSGMSGALLNGNRLWEKAIAKTLTYSAFGFTFYTVSSILLKNLRN